MAKVRDLPLANYPNGTRTFIKQTPNGLDGFLLEIGRCTAATPTIWPNTTTKLSIQVVPSYDGGVTFDPTAEIGRADITGGVKIDSKTGLEKPIYVFGGDFRPAPNAVKVTITITGGPLRSYADVTVL
jgi:hypothetical protein